MSTPQLPRVIPRQLGERCAQLLTQRTGQRAAFYAHYTPRDLLAECVGWAVADAAELPDAFSAAATEHGLTVLAAQVADQLVVDGPAGELIAALPGVRCSHLYPVK